MQRGFSALLLIIGGALLTLIVLFFVKPELFPKPTPPQQINDNYNGITINQDTTISVPRHSSGQIVFVKDGNIWLSEGKGTAHRVTSDATKKISELLTDSIYYMHPTWSVNGDKFAFQQQSPRAKIANFVSDGTKISNNGFMDSDGYFPPYWLSNDKLLSYDGAVVTDTLDGIKWSGSNEPGDPYFQSLDRPDGCGGGGRPDWSYKLSANHSGGMDGIRATFLYLPTSQTLVYSNGCEREQVEKLRLGSTASLPFDPSRQIAVQQIAPTDEVVPTELVLSPDQTMLAGSVSRNIVLYDLNGKLLKTLTNSMSAYGPVWSRDGKTIFYANNFGSKPTLESIDVDGNNQKILFTGSKEGAISNISNSPDLQQLIFTLIQQDQPTNIDTDTYPTANQDLYLINSDGSKPALFAKDAYQDAWSPR